MAGHCVVCGKETDKQETFWLKAGGTNRAFICSGQCRNVYKREHCK